jgi:hypothetical protein
MQTNGPSCPAYNTVYMFTPYPSCKYPGLACTVSPDENTYEQRLIEAVGAGLSLKPTLRHLMDARLCRMFPCVDRQAATGKPFTIYSGLKQKWGLADICEWKVRLTEGEALHVELICVTTDQRPDIQIENIVVQGQILSATGWRVLECRLIDAVHRPCLPVEADWVVIDD